MAILAILAAHESHGVPRDKLIGLLWPDRTEERARHVLSQSLYALRRSLGAELFLAPNGLVRLNPQVISSDVAEFAAALRSRDDERTIEVYRGSFLDGFHLSGLPEFEQWQSSVRARLATAYASALERRAQACLEARALADAADLCRKWVSLDLLDSRAVLQLMIVLNAADEQAAAIREGDRHNALRKRELGAAPDPRITELLVQLRKGRLGRRGMATRHPAAHVSLLSDSSSDNGGPATIPSSIVAAVPHAAVQPRWPRRRAGTVAMLFIGALAISAALWSGGRRGPARGNGTVGDLRARTHAYDLATQSATPGSMSGVSPIGRSFYEEGLRAYYIADLASARRLFGAALAADSTFAMAAHYLALTVQSGGGKVGPYAARAQRLALLSTERERLIILHHWAEQEMDPRAFAYAETLSTRYPSEPDALLAVARARISQGRFADAVRRLRALAEKGQTDEPGPAGRCRACETRSWLMLALQLADSLPAAERMARIELRTHAREPAVWGQLAGILERQGRLREADSAYAQELTLAGALGEPVWRPALSMRAGDFAASERQLRVMVGRLIGVGRDRALEQLSAVLRNRGRPSEAMEIARRIRMAAASTVDGAAEPFTRLPMALALLYGGHGREAAAQFDTMSASSTFRTPSRAARHKSWMMAQRAHALAIAGDTGALAALADSVRIVGERSAYGRDQRLHHYVRGLQASARQDWPVALRELRLAQYSTTETYLAAPLARAELAIGDARGAVKTVSAALRGPLDSQNQYELRTELHLILAEAYLASSDSTASARQYRIAARAWEGAEPPFAERGRLARTRWRQLASASRAVSDSPARRTVVPFGDDP